MSMEELGPFLISIIDLTDYKCEFGVPEGPRTSRHTGLRFHIRTNHCLSFSPLSSSSTQRLIVTASLILKNHGPGQLLFLPAGFSYLTGPVIGLRDDSSIEVLFVDGTSDTRSHSL